ncbi:unnamed protein product [Caenorhabditis auriculariae]|uniref:DUF4708 domain-containing protein n=1 Tax=Caenorhabditis auriculariae TaxID=2777116 RepID=A0A8S1GU43_9PELO|nr:unnamed protein product [Caenorhabditis auriculariae]
MTTNTSLLVSVNLENLIAVYLKIDMKFDNRHAAEHGVQQQICRDIIQNTSFLKGSMVSPQRDLSSVLLLGKRDIIDSKEFSEWLQQVHLTVFSKEDANSYALEKCTKYSLFCWMQEAGWNKVGTTLMNAKNLFETNTYCPRMKIDLHCTNSGEVYMKTSAEFVSMLFLELWDLGESEKTFRQQSQNVKSRWVTCLPKLGKGRVVRIHREVPNDSPFSDYSQVKTYWKNVYGYRLPSGPPPFFCDVLFNGERDPFLYPSYCVLSSNPDPVMSMLSREDSLRDALQKFQNDLKSRKMEFFGVACNTSQKVDRSAERFLNVLDMIPNKKPRLTKDEVKMALPEKSFPKVEQRKSQGDSPAYQPNSRVLNRTCYEMMKKERDLKKLQGNGSGYLFK